MSAIKTVCVIGAGVMGSGIAAQVANSSTKVILLDVVDYKSGDRNKIVKDAYNKLFTQKPSPLSHPDYAKYLKLGNLEDDIALIGEADLIIEVIIEKSEIKHQLYSSIIKYLKPTAILASNTSTLPLSELKKNLPDDIKKRFVITHFFNPPRYLELLELITDANTSNNILSELSIFLTQKLGKTIVKCNDTPGFIANRIGCFLLELTVRKAIKENLNPIIIDSIFSKHLGFPNTGIFGLYDLIGHDVMNLISNSLLKSLPDTDRYHHIYDVTNSSNLVLENMRKQNLIGRKTGGGFFKLSKDADGNSVKQVIDFNALSYHSSDNSKIEGKVSDGDSKTISVEDWQNLDELLNSKNEYSKFITEVLKEFFSYVISLIPSVTNNMDDIDKAMQLGYSLRYGPFTLLEKMPGGGKNWLKLSGINNEILDITGTKIENKDNSSTGFNRSNSLTVLSNNSAELRKIDGKFIFAIKSKMNVLDHDVFNLIIEAVDYCEKKQQYLYFLPNGNNFSAGANLANFKELITKKDSQKLEEFIKLGQQAMMTLKYAKIPVISCAIGFALGGGCEILLHSHFIVAHQNLNAGLVELGVGLIPGWGGTKEMFLRSISRAQLVQHLKNILVQNKSNSADYFSLDYSVPCSINMNRSLILQQAFTHKFDNFIPRNLQKEIELPNVNLADEFQLEKLDEVQLDILEFFQKIIDKKFVTEQQLLDFERDKFIELAFKPAALKRISKFV